MKILFLDSHKDVQRNWIDPLRAEGWGVVLARTVEDAAKLMALHGDGVEAIVAHESLVSFAEKADKPYLILTESWTERDILKHQNSNHSAKGYLPYAGAPKRVIGFWGGASSSNSEKMVGATKEGVTGNSIKLVEATKFLKRPEITRTRSTSLSLRAPSKTMSGRSTNTAIQSIQARNSSLAPDPIEMPVSEGTAARDFEAVEATRVEPIFREVEDHEGDADQSTRMIDRTSVTSGLRISPLEESSDPLSFESPLESVRREVDSYFAPRAPEPRPALKLVTEANPDVEALRNYLAMREQDVAVLSGQIRSSKERISQVEDELKMEKARNAELQELLSRAEQTLKGYDLEKRVEMEVVEKQVDDLDRQLRERTEKARVIETKLRLMNEEVMKVKERVRVDVRRIRVREKELEGQLEILKKDSAALLQARDEKILELKRRVDLLEFNMELAQEQYEKERRSTDELRSKLRDAADAMKQANGYLEQ
ncbi:MAG: hypothetical protein KGP28_07820 [Bdellovibrionales bacterium]|nr:hypothetical protein [Bdellovibrionales bacterium]